MPRLYRIDSGDTIGEISDDQLQFLIDQLVEEDDDDRDYYINRDTLDMLREANADAKLMEMLERAMGDGEDIDIGWE